MMFFDLPDSKCARAIFPRRRLFHGGEREAENEVFGGRNAISIPFIAELLGQVKKENPMF